MLHLRIADEPCSIDIQEEFERLYVEDRPEVRKILERLEQGKYDSYHSFLNQFGDKVPISLLCSGTKAALVTAMRPDMEVNLIECGYNAIGCILSCVTEGQVVVHPEICYWSIYRFGEDTSCDVALEGYRFTDLSKLNEYITEYWPNPLPYLYDGIEELEPHDLSFYERFLNKPGFPPLGTRISGV